MGRTLEPGYIVGAALSVRGAQKKTRRNWERLSFDNDFESAITNSALCWGGGKIGFYSTLRSGSRCVNPFARLFARKLASSSDSECCVVLYSSTRGGKFLQAYLVDVVVLPGNSRLLRMNHHWSSSYLSR